MLRLRHWPAAILNRLLAILAPIRTAHRLAHTADWWKAIADTQILNHRAALANLREDLSDRDAELQAAEGTITHLKKLLETEKADHFVTQNDLRKARAEIEVQAVSIAGSAGVIAQYEARFGALTRIEAMKGQPPTNEPVQFNS